MRNVKLLGLLLFFVFSGCRMYGAYDSAEVFALKLQEGAAQSEAAYDRLQREHEMLRRAAEVDPSLESTVGGFAAVVELQQTVTAAHREATEKTGGFYSNILFRWVGPDNYRVLHRRYGALVSDQKIVDHRYDAVCADVLQRGAVRMQQEEGRYQIAPHFYHRSRTQCSVSDMVSDAGGAE